MVGGIHMAVFYCCFEGIFASRLPIKAANFQCLIRAGKGKDCEAECVMIIVSMDTISRNLLNKMLVLSVPESKPQCFGCS